MNKRIVMALLAGWLIALVVQPRDIISKVRG
jgi:hypothetical protein